MSVWPALAILTVLFIDRVLDWSRRGLIVSAVSDETAHLLTALLLVAAVPRRIPLLLVTGTLSASVLIDLDHLPLLLGSDLLTQQTGRPVTHALWLIALALILAMTTRARVRLVLLSISFGLMAHFIRDLATTSAGVPLLWPISAHGFTIPYEAYVALLLGCWAALARRIRSYSHVEYCIQYPGIGPKRHGRFRRSQTQRP